MGLVLTRADSDASRDLVRNRRSCRLVVLEDGKLRIGGRKEEDREGSVPIASPGTEIAVSSGSSRVVRWSVSKGNGPILEVADARLLHRVDRKDGDGLDLEWERLAKEPLESGLEVRHVAWHPESENHLGVLTSDNVFRLYNVAKDTSNPEQEIWMDITADGEVMNLALSQLESFTFGSGDLWERFAVFFASRGGNIYYICPVAPFGAVVMPSLVRTMHKVSTFRSDQTTNAALSWVEAAFGKNALSRQADDETSLAVVRPHCLEWTSPCLVGPFPEGSSPPLKSDASLRHTSTCMLHFPLYSSPGRILVTAQQSSTGVHILIHLLYGSTIPAWLEDSPQVGRNSQGRIEWTISSAGVHHPSRHPLVAFLLDRMDLRVDRVNQLHLVDDPSHEHCLYLAAGNKVYHINLSYVERIGQALLRDDLSTRYGSQIGLEHARPVVEELFHPFLPQCSSIAGAVAGGGPLDKGYLQVWTDRGAQLCLMREGRDALPPMDKKTLSAFEDAREISAELTQLESESWKELELLYKGLTSTPEATKLPSAPPCGKQSIESQKYIHSCAMKLKEQFFGYMHKSHDDLLQRIDLLGKEASKQEAQHSCLEAKLAKAKSAADKLQSRTSQAELFLENLQERIKLLLELENSVAWPLSAAEKAFMGEADNLASNLPHLEARLRQMMPRVEKLEEGDTIDSSHGRINSSQLKKLYAMISHDAGQVQLCIEKVRRLQVQLEDLESTTQ